MPPIRMAQYSTKHGHAAGKLISMCENPEVEMVGVFEPDAARLEVLEKVAGPFAGVHWFESAEAMLDDASIVAVASEGRNDESLAQTEQIIRAGKHVWYDKPSGDDLTHWQRVADLAEENDLFIQMGYMFRYHNGFGRIADWVKSGLLGRVFSVRAHMSTWLTIEQREIISRHQGGIFYDLAGHMLDQIVWLLGRPAKVTPFFRQDGVPVPNFADNTLVVFEFEQAMATIDIAALETRPMARRFEVYGTDGSAIIMEPFEPAESIRLCLAEARGGYQAGSQIVQIEPQSRQRLYDLELGSFLAVLRGQKEPDRSLDHDRQVQESLLRATQDR